MLKEILQSLKAKGGSSLIEDGIHMPLKAHAAEDSFGGKKHFHLDIGYLRDEQAYDYRLILDGFLPGEKDDFGDAEIVIERALQQLWTGDICSVDSWTLTERLSQIYFDHFAEWN